MPTRPAKSKKAEFTPVNEHFFDKHNEVGGHYRRTLVREADRAESKADFIHKMGVAQKEADETDYWIELLFKSDYIDEIQFNSIVADINEINKLIASIIITAKKNRNK